MLIIGLTGGISTGKSTVSLQLRERHGIRIIDADVIAREVVDPGKPAYSRIVEHFSQSTPDLLQQDGKINRAALAQTVFSDNAQLKLLNSIVHPAVRREIAMKIIKAWLRGCPVVVADVPLLFEAGLDRFCGTSVVVLCDEEMQYRRLRERNPHISAIEARNRIAAQMPLAEKRWRADYVLENNGPLDELHREVDLFVEKFYPSPWRTYIQWIPFIGALWAAVVLLWRLLKVAPGRRKGV